MSQESSITYLVSRFAFVRVLASDPQIKTLSLLGSIDGQQAIISVEKTAFPVIQATDAEPSSKKQKLVDGKSFLTCQSPTFDINELVTSLKVINHNDIYHWSLGLLEQNLETNPAVKLNLVYPATTTHIKKYDTQKYHFVQETPEVYTRIVKPYIESMQGDRIQWVRNILYCGKEKENVVFREDNSEYGYVLLPDMKWDGINIDSLYLVAIVLRTDIASLRDLNETHIPWLESLRKELRTKIPQHYENRIASDELRIFVHYQPSYYHFHIHVANIKHSGLGDGIAAGKAVLLEDVIEQLKYLGPDGFANKTIGYVIGENHDLWRAGLKEEQEKLL
ncbi:hypothetical protein BABINDRAFT_158907 [Babjeviella inositovora NRRL Y-12698]|uniref:HIT domain-containing protein n=1 Tax=Babjeviella inositovora NRRL Y-12698 TaxID=984486 RepID=A0A1E3QX99_9ASCO|nr:uncharacterized protein BABINDRAFT_158907 [Babjeviella inositovora NRRL Y-12698]ODQ82280.1 hypothetical protein BABINDRAFT_158907 [Babjeviella inositovora NRRL Y-12698]